MLGPLCSHCPQRFLGSTMAFPRNSSGSTPGLEEATSETHWGVPRNTNSIVRHTSESSYSQIPGVSIFNDSRYVVMVRVQDERVPQTENARSITYQSSYLMPGDQVNVKLPEACTGVGVYLSFSDSTGGPWTRFKHKYYPITHIINMHKLTTLDSAIELYK